MVSRTMLSSLLQKQLSFVPEPQHFFTHVNEAWRPRKPIPATTSQEGAFKSLYLITWNIDFMAPHPRARMTHALDYLENLVSNIPSSAAVVIFLQEMMEYRGSPRNLEQEANDLSQLCNSLWVKDRFHLSDVEHSIWDATYGQVTLIDRRLSVAQVSRLQFVSEYQRDALIVDIPLGPEGEKVLRLCNVHLDSTYGSMRPVQWKAIAKHMQDEHDDVAASIVAGDCNANQPRDWTEPRDNGFKDAFLELGGVEGDESGATWGFQSLYWERWGRKRLDKVVFWGNAEVKSLDQIGMGVKVNDEYVTKELEGQGELPFVTDHYGLMSEFTLKDGLCTISAELQMPPPPLSLQAATTPSNSG